MILVLTWILNTMVSTAQEVNHPYYFEEEDVVFVFDVRNYAKALLGENALKVDFADLGIYEVAVTGQFNNWNKKGWKMTKRDEFVFELRKRIHDFNDAFPLDFRYIINGRYLADPDGTITDKRQFEDNFLEDIYKVDFSVIKIVEEGQGNVRFFLNEHYEATEVILAGSFNGWKEHELKMNKVAAGWELYAELPPGRYEYKFIVDGEWIHDPVNKESVKNEHHTLNSVLYVTLPVTFTLKGYPDARTVVLAGSFNNWNEKKLEMTRSGDGWTATLPLFGGKHTYKFLIDGKWITDPDNPIKEDDGYGNINSVRFVY
jgi:1,4-alpha-glucan branching enzyme